MAEEVYRKGWLDERFEEAVKTSKEMVFVRFRPDVCKMEELRKQEMKRDSILTSPSGELSAEKSLELLEDDEEVTFQPQPGNVDLSRQILQMSVL
ncbi:hypothetical protein Bca52824_014636 [Brassica carinata]|uniref:Uncharacterized protein n=1 Tax=Brassica carinata TaxID=52824 RepID=A0A8X7W069_BRACI|nr:hypothetical protein Bca52824_014636 [Brassica carinata]